MALPQTRSDGTPFPCKLSEDDYKKKLTGPAYRCLRQGGTEAYRRGEFCNFFPDDGYMACARPPSDVARARGGDVSFLVGAACDIPLYSAKSKFADPGWDAYASCYWTGDNCHVGVRPDGGALENFCNNCGSHLVSRPAPFSSFRVSPTRRARRGTSSSGTRTRPRRPRRGTESTRCARSTSRAPRPPA